MLPVADWVILAALAVVIGLCVRYARRHPRVPPELSGWHVYCGGQTAVVQFYRNAKNGYLIRCNGLGTLTGKLWRKRCPGSVQSNLTGLRIARLALGTFGVIAAAVTLIAVIESYSNLLAFARTYGLSGWRAAIAPGAVDSFIVMGELLLFAAILLAWGTVPHVMGITMAAWGFLLSVGGNIWHVPSATIADRGVSAIWPVTATAGLAGALVIVRQIMMSSTLAHSQNDGQIRHGQSAGHTASGAPVPRSSPPGRGTGTSLPALNTSGAPALPSPPAGGSTGTEPPPPVPPRREPRRAVNPREARKGPAAASARVVREQEVLQRLLASGASLPSARQLGRDEFGSYQSASAKRVLEQARAAMNGHGASG